MKIKTKLKFKPKTSFAFLIIGIFIVGGITVGSNDVDGVLFSLTDPGKPVPGIDCWAKASTSFGGDEVAKSSFLSNSPTFDLTTITSETDISGDFTHDGRIRCTFPIADESNTTLPLIVAKNSVFKISVYAYEEGIDDKQLVFSQTKTLDKDVELLWNTESDFVSFDVPLKNVVDGLKSGKYEATAEFRIEGTPIMGYKGSVSNNFSWQFPIQENNIRTWVDFPIDKTTAKVTGVIDNGKNVNLEIRDSENKSGDDATEFIECLKVMNTECLFNEKFNTYWMVIGVGGLGLMYMERSRQ